MSVMTLNYCIRESCRVVLRHRWSALSANYCTVTMRPICCTGQVGVRNDNYLPYSLRVLHGLWAYGRCRISNYSVIHLLTAKVAVSVRWCVLKHGYLQKCPRWHKTVVESHANWLVQNDTKTTTDGITHKSHSVENRPKLQKSTIVD